MTTQAAARLTILSEGLGWGLQAVIVELEAPLHGHPGRVRRLKWVWALALARHPEKSLQKSGGSEVAGEKNNLFFKLAFFVAFGSIVLSIILGHDGSDKVAMSDLKKAARSSLPLNWPTTSEATINRGTFIGYAVSKNSPVDIIESSRAIEKLASAEGFHEKSNIGSNTHYRKVFCRQSTALDVEIYKKNDKEFIVESGAYWASQKSDSRYCR
ncbi:hypothetical protein [Xanthomonas sacchari]|uniref:hypothetical protein n=1 Tax=Xanthomonas sacchari TaxID=56458 RepID=UPI003B228861